MEKVRLPILYYGKYLEIEKTTFDKCEVNDLVMFWSEDVLMIGRKIDPAFADNGGNFMVLIKSQHGMIGEVFHHTGNYHVVYRITAKNVE